jgi:hypothetical protein
VLLLSCAGVFSIGGGESIEIMRQSAPWAVFPKPVARVTIPILTNDRDGARRAVAMLGLALVVIALGLGLRFVGRELGLPAGLVKYGGSVLWATMVFFLVAALRPRLPRPRLALVAMVIAVGVELIRLVHTPWLDAFRLTLTGALLLGRIFSLWNLVAYAAGIVLGVAVDLIVCVIASEATRPP